MKGDAKDKKNNEVRVELKYCEHCGALWLREPGAGVVYCDNCRLMVADLPAPQRKRGRLTLPVRPHTAVEDYKSEVGDVDKIRREEMDQEKTNKNKPDKGKRDNDMTKNGRTDDGRMHFEAAGGAA